MILNKEQIEGIEDCRKANVKLTNDLLDTIADLKRQLAYAQEEAAEYKDELVERKATMTVYQQDEVQWFTKPELAAYVQEKVDQILDGIGARFRDREPSVNAWAEALNVVVEVVAAKAANRNKVKT